MELKRFVGSDSKATMDQVRARYGDDALIISTNKVGNKTEMICAVEAPISEPGDKPQANPQQGLDISEATSTVASLLNRVAASAAGKEGLSPSVQAKKQQEPGVSRVAKAFGQELESALNQHQQTTTASSSPDVTPSWVAEEAAAAAFTPTQAEASADQHAMRAMMQTIQQDLAQLRTQLEQQAAAQGPIRQAQLAMASINQRVAEHAADTNGVAGQVQTLISQPISMQRDWAGTHAFVGQPGVGKSTVIAELVQQLSGQQDNPTNVAVLSLQRQPGMTGSELPRLLEPNHSGLAQLCQGLGVVYLQAKDPVHLGQLLARYRQDHCVFIDTSAAELHNEQGLINLIAEHEVLPHLCVAGDASTRTIDQLVSRIPWIASSVVITRFNLVPDPDALIASLDACSAKISGVSGHLVDDQAADDKKSNSANTLEE
jgi:hypothetical protein